MSEIPLFLDTETTGFRKGWPLVQDGQARVCQVAMILTDSIGNPLMKYCSLIKPNGWTISEGARNCHGITDEMCHEYGVAQETAMRVFLHMADRATTVVAHHMEFDKAMMNIEAAYYSRTENPATRKPWYCTQNNSIEICKIPPTDKMKQAGRHHYKTPSLEEALKHFCNRSLGDGAHDAMNDAEACKDIFFALRGRA